MGDIEDLRLELRKFAEDRNWPQFHDPKNLAMAVASEAGELLAELRWLTSEESQRSRLSPERLADIRYEMADVFIFLIRMSDVLDIDLRQAVLDKLRINAKRFPV